jgi:PAT family beta-lactamase induction signal transducer AmpG
MSTFFQKLNSFFAKGKSTTIKNKWVLSENPLLRYFTFSSLYVAQGIPEGLTFFAIPAWLAMNGKSAAEVGSFIAVIGIPWSFKILVAPLMDRFSFLPMGKRRPWVICGQLGLIISLFSMAFVPDPVNNLSTLMIAGFFVSFFGAFQDVATDGMAIDIVPIKEQARANGLMWGSKTIGISLSVAGSTFIINTYGFNYAAITLAFTITCIILFPIFFREKPGEKLLPWTKGTASESSVKMQLKSWKTIFKSLIKVFFLPSSLLMGVAVFSICIGFGLMDAILPVFSVQKIGWTNTYYANIVAIANITAGLLGMFVGGALVDFFGKTRMMTIYLVTLMMLVIFMAIFKNSWTNSLFVPGFIIAYYILFTFLNIAIFAAAMELCWKRISATQFTLYMAIANIGRATGAGMLGGIKDFFEVWEYVILVIALFALIMIVLIRRMNVSKHLINIDNLESNYVS